MTAVTIFLMGSTASAASTPDSLEAKSTRFATGRTTAAAVWTGTDIVIFGGWTAAAPTDQIVTYNPAANGIAVKTSKLPLGRSALAAVWTGTHAYVFGGWNGLQSNEVIKYDPVADQLTVLPTTIPGGRSEISAVWTGSAAYIFGGSDGMSTSKILKFTPSSGAISQMSATLPTAREGTSAVWAGSVAYIFGGTNGGKQILRYDPTLDEIKVMGAELPSARHRTASFWDGRHAYVFGGDPNTDQIIRYDPATDNATVLALELPTARSGMSAVWAGDRGYVVNGCCVGGSTYITDILEFHTANRAPTPRFVWSANGLTVEVDAGNAVDPDGTIVSYGWNWGDGTTSSIGPKTSHTYQRPDNVTLTLSITDNRGLTETLSTQIDVVAASTSGGSADDDEDGGGTGGGGGSDGSTPPPDNQVTTGPAPTTGPKVSKSAPRTSASPTRSFIDVAGNEDDPDAPSIDWVEKTQPTFAYKAPPKQKEAPTASGLVVLVILGALCVLARRK